MCDCEELEGDEELMIAHFQRMRPAAEAVRAECPETVPQVVTLKRKP